MNSLGKMSIDYRYVSNMGVLFFKVLPLITIVLSFFSNSQLL